MLIKKMLFVILTFITTISLASCSDDENTTSPTPAEKANVLVVHASPDAPGVDLLVDNTVAGTNLTFPNNTGYLSVNAGTRNVKVNVNGTSTTVIQANLNLVANKNYSVFAVNQVSAIEPLVFEDDLTTPASGKAHVRFIHLSPNAPAVNITLTDGTIVFGNVAFKGSVNFTPLNAGTYNLQVRDAATNATVVLELPNITLQAGKIYTVFAKGLLGVTGAQELGAQIIVNK
ncbi:MAG: DUF4397 domain-containing protein [Ignavibacterium sp.]|jgi:hypothetical protein|uniref:DUF4397 domain-containing protein n=1 Tax=Ignavibacterium sp. TaxID=2651167 RepID=UPI00329798E4